jgi:hypothetical protein
LVQAKLPAGPLNSQDEKYKEEESRESKEDSDEEVEKPSGKRRRGRIVNKKKVKCSEHEDEENPYTSEDSEDTKTRPDPDVVCVKDVYKSPDNKGSFHVDDKGPANEGQNTPTPHLEFHVDNKGPANEGQNTPPPHLVTEDEVKTVNKTPVGPTLKTIRQSQRVSTLVHLKLDFGMYDFGLLQFL